jgi:hypothetical protein
VLIGQGEKLTHRSWAHATKCLEQPFDDGTQHFLGL